MALKGIIKKANHVFLLNDRDKGAPQYFTPYEISYIVSFFVSPPTLE